MATPRAMRAIYAVPVVALVGTGVGLGIVLKKWRSNADDKKKNDDDDDKGGGGTGGGSTGAKRDDYDDRIDAELKDLDV